MYRKFEGKLNGVTLDELRKLFFEDYYDQAHSADNRVEDVKRFLKEQSNWFFEDYCCEQFLSKKPADQVMSENDSVAHFMEVLATYMILGEDEEFPYKKDLFFVGN